MYILQLGLFMSLVALKTRNWRVFLHINIDLTITIYSRFDD